MNSARSLVLCLSLVLGALPLGAFGADPIQAAAVGEGTYVLAEFISETCPACQDMRPVVETVLSRYPRVRHQVHDADLEVDLSKAYGVKCVPVYVVVDPKGVVRFNDVGMHTIEELDRILRDAGIR